MHLSSQMSGTVESARLAAKESPVPTEVVDSGSLGMGLGFAVVSAAIAAAEGRPADEVARAARDRADASSAVFYVDTLEYLRRGGRIGAAAAMLGSALAVKPLLHLVDGHIEPLEKVRTSARRSPGSRRSRPARPGRGRWTWPSITWRAPDRAEALAGRLRGPAAAGWRTCT